MGRRPKTADLGIPDKEKEAIWNMCGGEPFAVHMLVTLQNCRDWAADEIPGPVCIRETGMGEVTFFLLRCAPEPLQFFEDWANAIRPVTLEINFRIGIWRYLWNRLALLVWGR